MQVELYCPHCRRRFAASPCAPAGEVLERITEEGPGCALGDGETVEDCLSAALNARGPIPCPDCGETARLDEESLGRLTQLMLANW